MAVSQESRKMSSGAPLKVSEQNTNDDIFKHEQSCPLRPLAF